MIEAEYSNPHGNAFWKWAHKLMAHDACRAATAAAAQRTGVPTAFPPSPTSSSTATADAAGSLSLGWGGAPGGFGSKRVVVSGHGQGMGWSSLGADAGEAEGGAAEDRNADVEGPEGELIITRLHSFKTHMAHRWQCTSERCVGGGRGRWGMRAC